MKTKNIILSIIENNPDGLTPQRLGDIFLEKRWARRASLKEFICRMAKMGDLKKSKKKCPCCGHTVSVYTMPDITV